MYKIPVFDTILTEEIYCQIIKEGTELIIH